MTLRQLAIKSLAPILIGAGLLSFMADAATLDLELEHPSWAKQAVVELGSCQALKGKVKFGRAFLTRGIPTTALRYSIAGVPEVPTCIRLSWHADGVELVSPEISVAFPSISMAGAMQLLAAQTVIRITAAPTPGGVVSSKFRDGDDGTAAIPLTWATIPPYTGLIEGAGSGPQCRDSRQYLTEAGSPDATLSLVGSVANFSLSTDDLCYDDSGVSSGTLVLRATRNTEVSDSLPFAVSSVAAASTDTTAPTIPVGVTVSLDGNDDPVITFDAPADVRVTGEDVSGLDTFTVLRNGTPLTPTAFTGTGLAPTFTSADIGTLTPAGEAVQDGADWAHTAEGGVSLHGDEFLFTSTPITGDFTCTVKVASTSGQQSSARNGGLMMMEDTAGQSKFFGVELFTTGNSRAYNRVVTGGAETQVGLVTLPSAVGWLQIERAGDVLTARVSEGGNDFGEVDTRTLGLNSTVLAGIDTKSAEDGVEITTEYENLACTSRPRQTFTDTGATPGTTPSYTVIATDAEGNDSAASVAVTIDVPAAPPPANTDTPDYVDPIAGATVGTQTVVSVSDNADLTTKLGTAACGQTFRLANGTYGTARTLTLSCPAESPFIIECLNARVCVQSAAITLRGARNIVRNIKFSGANAKAVCQGTNNRLIANEFTGWTNGNAITVSRNGGVGTQCEIAYNEIHTPGAYPGGTNGGSAGQRIGIRSGEDTSADFHYDVWAHHNYFHDFPEKPIPTNYGSGQSDAIELCQTAINGVDSGWYIEDTLVEDHAQGGGIGAGTIDLKCGGAVARRITFINSPGRLDARQGSVQDIIEAVWLDDDSGGMEIRGNSHIVVGNRVRGGGIKVMTGNQECTNMASNTRPRACDAYVAGNDVNQLRISFQCGGCSTETMPAVRTTIRDQAGTTITFGVAGHNTTDERNLASTRDFEDAVIIDDSDVGPAAVSDASAAYKAARDLD